MYYVSRFISIYDAENEKAFGTASIRIPFVFVTLSVGYRGALLEVSVWAGVWCWHQARGHLPPRSGEWQGPVVATSCLLHLMACGCCMLYTFFKLNAELTNDPSLALLVSDTSVMIKWFIVCALTSHEQTPVGLGQTWWNALITNMVQCIARSARRYSSFPASVRNYKLAIQWTNDLAKQEHGTTLSKIHLSLFYFCPWTKRSWLRNFHDARGSEAAEAPWSCATWLLGDTWNRRGLARVDGWQLSFLIRLVGCSSFAICLSAGSCERRSVGTAIFYKRSLRLCDCDIQWMKPTAMSLLALHK